MEVEEVPIAPDEGILQILPTKELEGELYFLAPKKWKEYNVRLLNKEKKCTRKISVAHLEAEGIYELEAQIILFALITFFSDGLRNSFYSRMLEFASVLDSKHDPIFIQNRKKIYDTIRSLNKMKEFNFSDLPEPEGWNSFGGQYRWSIIMFIVEGILNSLGSFEGLLSSIENEDFELPEKAGVVVLEPTSKTSKYAVSNSMSSKLLVVQFPFFESVTVNDTIDYRGGIMTFKEGVLTIYLEESPLKGCLISIGLKKEIAGKITSDMLLNIQLFVSKPEICQSFVFIHPSAEAHHLLTEIKNLIENVRKKATTE